MFRTYAIAIIALATVASLAHADKERFWGQPDQRTILMGTIGDDLRIMVDLAVHDTESAEDNEITLRGHYVYQHVGVPIELTGQRVRRDGLPSLLLIESVDGEVTGHWQLHCQFLAEDIADAPPPLWVGTWTSADGERTQSIELELAAEFELGRRSLAGLTVEWAFPMPTADVAAYEALSRVYDQHREHLDANIESAMLPEAQSNDFRADRLRGRMFWDEINSTVVCWDDGIISVLFEQYTNGGGAHPNFFYHTVVLVRRDGEYHPLKLEDVFLDSQDVERTLSPLVIAQLVEGGWDRSRTSFRTQLVFSVGDLQYFTVSARGLTVYFEPYAIASYAEGAFVVTVAWEDLGSVIDPEGALGRWVE